LTSSEYVPVLLAFILLMVKELVIESFSRNPFLLQR